MVKDKVKCSVPRCTIVTKLVDGICEEHSVWLSSQAVETEPSMSEIENDLANLDISKSSENPDNALITFLKTNFTQINKNLEEVKKDMKETKNVIKTVTEQTEVNKKDIKSNSDKIMALEAKVGDSKECAIPQSITFQNVPKFNASEDETVKEILRNINYEDMNVDSDVTKVIRKGYKPQTGNNPEKLGTIFVELRTPDIRSKIMKTKKVLANHQDKTIQNIRIRNMVSQQELNQQYFNRQILKMTPGGNQFYIAANGSIKPVTQPPTSQPPPNYPRVQHTNLQYRHPYPPSHLQPPQPTPPGTHPLLPPGLSSSQPPPPRVPQPLPGPGQPFNFPWSQQ